MFILLWHKNGTCNPQQSADILYHCEIKFNVIRLLLHAGVWLSLSVFAKGGYTNSDDKYLILESVYD